MNDELIAVSEAAQRLGGISPWTVYAWLSQGRLQRTKVGSRTMVRESELLKMIRDSARSTAPFQKKEVLDSSAPPSERSTAPKRHDQQRRLR